MALGALELNVITAAVVVVTNGAIDVDKGSCIEVGGLVLGNQLGEVDAAVAVAAVIVLMVMVSQPCGIGSLAVVVAVILQVLILLWLWQ